MSSPSPLGIIAGSGALPMQIIKSCQAQQRPVFILGIEGTDMQPFTALPHAQVRLGAVGEALSVLRNAGVKELVLAGGMKRPSFTSIIPDAVGAKLLARVTAKLIFGDDALLKTVIKFLEEEGFKVLGSDDILRDLLTPKGQLGLSAPDARDTDDIAQGFKVAKHMGAYDIGQAVIVEYGYVLGVEAAEGTDALVSRCGALKREGRGGVLVKVKKPGQESRADLPSIGVQTVENAHSIGLAGIALEAGASLILGREAVIKKADELGLFIVGVVHE